jgi:NAD(P)-dependent dehydrogenase (short-subunit alcohol dehydrogenase family)
MIRRLAILSLAILIFTGETSFAQEESQKAVLITGASTGIGRNMAETLAKEGYFVYAGARKQADIEALSAIENIEGIRLDVTLQDDIDAAVSRVREAGRGLYGLINNAGVSVAGPMIEISEEDLWFQLNVNIFGVYRVTRAFAPLIIESKGRIITIGSISGVLSGFFSGPYAMSKHAMEAYTDALSAEMEKFDVSVSIIEPGNYNSSISRTRVERLIASGETGEGSLYEDEMKEMLQDPIDRSRYKEPDEVSVAALHALSDPKPHLRYMVVPRSEEGWITVWVGLAKLMQMNETQAYKFSREELIEMLDEAIEFAESRNRPPSN